MSESDKQHFMQVCSLCAHDLSLFGITALVSQIPETTLIKGHLGFPCRARKIPSLKIALLLATVRLIYKSHYERVKDRELPY